MRETMIRYFIKPLKWIEKQLFCPEQNDLIVKYGQVWLNDLMQFSDAGKFTFVSPQEASVVY